ncbi:MAG: hypothetical protein HND50_22165 [Calditrichaeota bacterium]|nr:hypothetical protein [Calditrichota bacterium]
MSDAEKKKLNKSELATGLVKITQKENDSSEHIEKQLKITQTQTDSSENTDIDTEEK